VSDALFLSGRRAANSGEARLRFWYCRRHHQYFHAPVG